jgi:hypothetical protein
VHLNTAGHKILGTCAAVVIADGVSDVRIYGGGTIFGGNAVIVGKDKDVTLDHLGLGGDSDLGGNGAAVEINGAKGVKVTNSTIGVSCEGFGIMGTVDLGTFSKDTITVSCFSVQGIVLDGRNNVIRGNTITFNNDLSGLGFDYAISVTRQSIVEGNTITLSASGGPSVARDIGINLAGNSNRVNGNKIVGTAPAALYGTFAAQGAINNSITRNSASGNQFDLFDSNGPPCVNLWKHNQFQTSGGAVACIN